MSHKSQWNSERKSTAYWKREDQESVADPTNDPMERVVSRSTLMVTCCSEHVGKNSVGVPWTPTVPSNLRRERKQRINNATTAIRNNYFQESDINIACPIYQLSAPRMQRAPSATSLIGPIASTSTSTAPLLGSRVASGIRRAHGTERPRRSAGSGPHPGSVILWSPTTTSFYRGGRPKTTVNYIQKRIATTRNASRRHIFS